MTTFEFFYDSFSMSIDGYDFPTVAILSFEISFISANELVKVVTGFQGVVHRPKHYISWNKGKSTLEKMRELVKESTIIFSDAYHAFTRIFDADIVFYEMTSFTSFISSSSTLLLIEQAKLIISNVLTNLEAFFTFAWVNKPRMIQKALRSAWFCVEIFPARSRGITWFPRRHAENFIKNDQKKTGKIIVLKKFIEKIDSNEF